jgi:ribosomal protein L3
MDIDEENNVIAIKGSVPGNRYGYLEVRASLRQKQSNPSQETK